MNVLLCNERLLFRFGVDRVLLLLGRGLKNRGHHVSVMANKFDRTIIEEFAEKIIPVPEGGGDYLNLNEFTAQCLETYWPEFFDEENRPDVVVIGGWPFFAAIPVFEQLGCRTVFIDCGAVPLDGFDEGGRITQEKLRRLRKDFLPRLTAITPISRFIAASQSRVEAGSVPVEPILLGADHMELALWVADEINLANQTGKTSTLKMIRTLQSDGGKVILNLGRWEPGCYKNSEAIFALYDALDSSFSHVLILILADPEKTEIPERYRNKVIPIGFPDDAELQDVMKQVDLGVTVSLWEGFNLPMAEMQWLNKPVLAFDVGAHPEVVMHPWYLCQDAAEMGRKAIDILGAVGGPDSETYAKASQRFHADFKWQSVVDHYETLFHQIIRPHSVQLNIYVDVSNACRDPANSGVIRVTRRICRELQRYCNPLFVVWGGENLGYVFPMRAEYTQLSQFNGPVINDVAPCSTDTSRLRLDNVGVGPPGVPAWLLLTETVMETNGHHIRAYAARSGMMVGAIFYDAIPILRPDLVKDAAIRDNHAAYMRGLAQCDLVVPISQFSAQSLRSFWDLEGIAGCDIVANPLPGEFGGVPREGGAVESQLGPINVLCVSTLEPRKNHYKLIEAVNLFASRNPQLDWRLKLVGNRYAGGDDIAEFVEQACRANPMIQWMGIIDDARLHQEYQECTFTIYASEIEGFGMPILESIWHGKPCICHEQGVMSELAVEGGCMTTDVTDVDQLASAIGELATNRSLYARLVEEASTRPIKTWGEYAETFWHQLIKYTPPSYAGKIQLTEKKAIEMKTSSIAPSWQDVLYAGCLTKEWQMNDSERLGLAAVLQRLKPKCAIEIGTYRGGSLSLISQYADVVFSIDIDPSIPEQFKQFSNVSFFTGPSQVILPTLLKELDVAGMPVEFVLIDGDHSAAGVKRDIEIMLDYVPKKPLIIMMHDGFNPECRRGMLEADWQKSAYVHYIDIDFIPGRVIEHGGGGDGEMWGGLAMAYFSPKTRIGKIDVGATAKRIFSETEELRYSQKQY